MEHIKLRRRIDGRFALDLTTIIQIIKVNKMDVDFIFKVAAIGIIVTVLNLLLVRSGREEQAMLTTLAGLVVVLLMIVKSISGLFSEIKGIFGL